MRAWQLNLLKAFILIACGLVSAGINVTLGAFLGIDRAALVVLGLLSAAGTVLVLAAVMLSGSTSTRS